MVLTFSSAKAEANLRNVEAAVRDRLGDDADVDAAVDAAISRLRASAAQIRRLMSDDDLELEYAKAVLLTNISAPPYDPLMIALLETMAVSIQAGYAAASAVARERESVKLANLEARLQVLPHERWTLATPAFMTARLRLARSRQAEYRSAAEVATAALQNTAAAVRHGMAGYQGGAVDSRRVK